MTDIDQRLQAEADRWRAAYLADGDTVPLVVPGRGRPRSAWRAWAVPVAAAAAVAAVTIGTVAAISHHPGSVAAPTAQPVVPFLNHSMSVDPSLNQTPGDPSAPACALSDFSVGTPVESAVADGNVLVRTVLTYHGAAACFLSPAGAHVTLESKGTDSVTPGPSSPLLPADYYTPPLGPGRVVILSATWSGSCTNGDKFSDLVFRFGDREISVPLTSGLVPTGECTGGKTSLVEHLFAGAAAGSPESLLATVNAPADPVTVGDPLDYTVSLTNSSATTVTFDPCPAYGMVLGTGNAFHVIPAEPATPANGFFTIDHWLLNCAQAPATLAAGQSLTFAMQMNASATANAGPTTTYLAWIWPQLRGGEQILDNAIDVTLQ